MSDQTTSWARRLRRLAALAAVGATVVVGRSRAIAANERRYGDILDRPESPGASPDSDQA